MCGFLLLTENVIAREHVEIVQIVSIGILLNLVPLTQVVGDLLLGFVDAVDIGNVYHHVN